MTELTWGDVIAGAAVLSNVGIAYIALKIRADIADLKLWAIDRFVEKEQHASLFTLHRGKTAQH
jgi:hypothetical protein